MQDAGTSFPIHLESEMHDVQFGELSNRALISFFMSRNIDIQVAKKYCQEINYVHLDRNHFGIAFPNHSGGYTILSPFVHQSYGVSDISIIIPHKLTRKCLVFENFLDFLAYKTLKAHGITSVTGAYIILNSTKVGSRALSIIAAYTKIYMYFSNTDEGKKAAQKLSSLLHKRAVDVSAFYCNYKTLSNYLLNKKNYKNLETDI